MNQCSAYRHSCLQWRGPAPDGCVLRIRPGMPTLGVQHGPLKLRIGYLRTALPGAARSPGKRRKMDAWLFVGVIEAVAILPGRLIHWRVRLMQESASQRQLLRVRQTSEQPAI